MNENYAPSHLTFDSDGKYIFTAYPDCIKVHLMDDVKPIMLDVIPKSYKEVKDLKINYESSYMFIAE